MGRKPKGVVETIVDAADKILHPDKPQVDGAEKPDLAVEGEGEKADAAPVADAKTTESESHSDADQMSEHQKFDKFKTEGEHLDDK